ncbi:MAG: hypothetical protein WBX05_19310, partial [Pseudolabrys sp.]
VNGAAEVLTGNATDVRTNMLANGLGPDGQPFTPAPNGGIPDHIDTVNVAGLVFNDSMTKLIGGVYSGNQQSIVDDLNKTATGLQNAITNQGITGHALNDVNQVIGLLHQEASLVGGIDPASPTPVSAVNGQINQIQAQILNVINHDPTLATLATGTDADGNPTTGFVALPPGTTPSLSNVVATAWNGGHNVAATAPVVAPVANGRGNDASTSPLATDPGAHGAHTADHAAPPHFHFEHLWG